MGLDMFLNKKTYVKKWNHQPAEERYDVLLTRGGNPVTGINTEKITYIEEEIANWRKANHIHSWFVDNVQDGIDNCGEYYVPLNALMELLRICKLVRDDNNLASALLPTQNGFFFGSTEYDEWYFKSIEYTIEVLEEEMSNPSTGEYYYSSSW